MIPILTITCNPAIDKSTSVKAVVPEKKLRCNPPQFEPGGGGVNVARAIHKLGGRATAIYPAGGHTGQFFNSLLRTDGVEAVPVETASFTRENLIVLDESSGLQYRFGMPGSPIKEREWNACLDAVASRSFEYLVFSGSLLPEMPVNIIADIADLCRRHGAKLIVDTSGPALKMAAEAGVFLLKPNLGELAALAGKDYLATEEIPSLCRDWIRKGAAQIFVVSMGKEGAMLITATELFLAKPPDVKILSTVGAGDSLVAGIVLSLAEGKGLEETLQFGVCCGTAATLNPGTELCRREDVIRLLQMLRQA